MKRKICKLKKTTRPIIICCTVHSSPCFCKKRRKKSRHKKKINRKAVKLKRIRTRPIPFQPIFPPPLYVPNLQTVEKDKQKETTSCGNFMLEGSRVKPQQIWKVGRGLQAVVTQICIYNSSSSTHAIDVIINATEQVNLQVHPGNTGTFTDKDVKNIEITAQSGEAPFIEGKYNVTSTFLAK